MLSTMMSYPLTLDRLIGPAQGVLADVEIVSRLPDRTIARTSYRAFHARAYRLARALRRLGLKSGERVATLMWNHATHLEAYFGIPLAGGVVHTLNLRLHPKDLAYIAGHAGDRFLIVDQVLLPLLEKFRDQAPFERVFVAGSDGPESYEALLASATEDTELPVLDEEQALGMCYTSGTTGEPKGVVYSHRSTLLHSLVSALPDSLCLSRDDTLLPVVPMFHVNAWGLPFTCTLVGTRQVYPGPHLDPESLLDLMEREKVTVAAGVPTVWMKILETLDKDPQRYHLQPGLRMIVGGSAAPEAMIRGFDRHGLTVLHAWGMTETSPIGTVARLGSEGQSLPADERYRRRAMQGPASALVEIRGSSGGAPLPWNGKAVGELEIRGPWVASSYFGLSDERDRWTEDGWFRTGDVVSIDERGWIQITDRLKDVIKSGGEWISSVELENALMGHPAVAEAAVVGLPHPKWTERPLACVVVRAGATVTADELRAHLAARYARFWVPDDVAFVEAIPRTSTGKSLKAELRKMFAGWKWTREI